MKVGQRMGDLLGMDLNIFHYLNWIQTVVNDAMDAIHIISYTQSYFYSKCTLRIIFIFFN